MSDLVCIVYYRDSDVEIRSREDWLAAPFRDVQLVKHRWPGRGKYVEVRTQEGEAPSVWKWTEGEHFWVWRVDQPRPFSCDWMELADHMREVGALGKDESPLSLTLPRLEAAGVKYGLNLASEQFEVVYRRAKADERIT